jgi:hypothetical protein
VFPLQCDVVLAILQEEIEFDILKGRFIDKIADIVLQLVYVLSLVFVPDFTQLL